MPRCLPALLLLVALAAHADPARFDLAGPKIDVRVTRAGVSLPIAQVPNLQPGDQLWLHPDLPATQSVHYLLIVAFLRGTTNPPPDNWFTRVETWKKNIRDEGVTITVPDGAEQAILFLAPETGGDFATLRSAVQGRPGIFVRASQDLTEAGFEQARIERYLEGIKRVPPSDQAALVEHSNLLARTLNLQPNPECAKRPPNEQYTCLTQTGSQTLLDDGHGQTLVAALSTGSGSDFINAASTTQLAGAGTYSAYVGALIDLVRIMNSFHTAQYQYIPAIALPTAESLNLRLNAPPSFHNPKSVLVIGLPAVQAAVPPPLRLGDPHRVSCSLDPHLTLQVDGAPLVFSTAFAYGLELTSTQPGFMPVALTADAFTGGLTRSPVVPVRHELPVLPVPGMPSPKPAAPPQPARPGEAVTGRIEGMWGFQHFTGPDVLLQLTPGEGWHLVASPDEHLIAGKPAALALQASGTACVQTVSLQPANKTVPWNLDSTALKPPQSLKLKLDAAAEAKPGTQHLAVQQFGRTRPDEVTFETYAEPANIDALSLHAGDAAAELTGIGLDSIESVSIKGANLSPSSDRTPKHLTLNLPVGAKAISYKSGEKLTAQVHLHDGRVLDLPTVVLEPRPALTLLRKRFANMAPAGALAIELTSADELPLGAQVIASLKSKAAFPRSERIEIELASVSSDEPAVQTATSAKLSITQGGVVMADSHTILVTFDPLKAFGTSAFGALRLRALAEDGTEGEWIPLATIVRLPTLSGLACPADPTAVCTLSGSGLFLVESIATDEAFSAPTVVPDGYVDPSINIPHPAEPTLYLKLHDDPTVIQRVPLPLPTVPTESPAPHRAPPALPPGQ